MNGAFSGSEKRDGMHSGRARPERWDDFVFWGRLIGTDLSSAEEWPGGFRTTAAKTSL